MAGLDINALFQQAQLLQEKMQRAQADLANKTVTGTAGGGMVIVTASGAGDIVKVQIEKQAVDPNDVAMLEDLVLTAVNAAIGAARTLQQETQAGSLQGLAGMMPPGFSP